MIQAIIISLALHGLIFVSLDKKPEKKPVETIEMEVKPSAPKNTPKGQKQQNKQIIESDKGDRPCKLWYGGIGLENSIMNDGTNLVTKVIPGYPAARYGIQVGDYILNGTEIKGEIGTQIFVQIRRGNTLYTHLFVREKICYE